MIVISLPLSRETVEYRICQKWRFSWLSGKYTTIDALSLTRSEHAVIVIVSSTRMNFTLQASKVKHPSYLEATWLEIFDRIYYWSTNWLYKYIFRYFLFFLRSFEFYFSSSSIASTTLRSSHEKKFIPLFLLPIRITIRYSCFIFVWKEKLSLRKNIHNKSHHFLQVNHW